MFRQFYDADFGPAMERVKWMIIDLMIRRGVLRPVRVRK